MRIKRIIVENYRSIKAADILPSRFSVFVGQNNHGKTNLFEAIEWFFNAKSSDDDQHFERTNTNIITVRLDFEDVVQSDIEKLATEGSKTKIKTMLDGATTFSVLKTSSTHKRRYFVGDDDKGNPTGLDAAVNEFLPKLEYVSTSIRLADVAKYKEKNPIGTMLSGVLTAIIEDSQDYKDFKKQFRKLFDAEDSAVRQELNRLGATVSSYLLKQFPGGTNVTFSVNPPEVIDLLKSFDTDVDDGIATKAEDKGDGMQRAIMLAIIQAFADYRKAQSGGGTFLFMIDEAELHLHPSAQRALKRALLDLSKTDQVLVNTHSSVLVVENDEAQKIFRVEKEAHVSSIVEVDDAGKADVVFELLGGSPADLLLPRNFLIVEGKCEHVFLTAVIRRFYGNSCRGLTILFAGGDLDEQEGSLLGVHKLFVPLAAPDNPIYKDRTICLIDKPNAQQQTKYAQFKSGYPYLFVNNQVFELPHFALEEYYPAPHTKTAEEAKALGIGGKVKYARAVAEQLTQVEFETGMPVVYESLMRCNQLAFGSSQS